MQKLIELANIAKKVNKAKLIQALTCQNVTN
jgi:hypothetical protein